MRAAAQRASALCVALAAAWAGAWALVISLLGLAMASQKPDPTVPDGDPCCGYPDTWGEVAASAGAGSLGLAITAGLLCVAGAATMFALTGRVPRIVRRRRLALRLAVYTSLGLSLSIAVALLHPW